MRKSANRIINKQQSVSSEALPKRTTVRIRRCLGILKNGTYCNKEFESLDAADRMCYDCKVRNGHTKLKETTKYLNSRRVVHNVE